MMGANHAITGAAAWVAVAAAVPPVTLGGAEIPVTAGLYVQSPAIILLGALIAAGAALLPDADHQSATIAHSVPLLGGVATSAIGDFAGGHRKGTHTILAAIVVTAASLLLPFATWDTGTAVGTISLGAGIAAAFLTAFASKVIRSITFVRSWLSAWILGFVVGAAVATLSPENVWWVPVAIGVGYVMHLVGDMLTVGGIAPFYPWLPKPPRWWQASGFLLKLWHKNGYMGIPILGLTGSMREWALGFAVTAYVLFILASVGLSLFGIGLGSLLFG